MGYTTSTVHGIEVPDSSETNNIPEDIGKVVTALEAGSLVKRLTGAAIAALTAPQKPAGLLVYNTTTNKLQVSDGTNFADVGAAQNYVTATQSGQTLAASTDITVTYNAEVDPSNMLNTGTGVVTIPARGLYTVAAGLGYTANSSASVFRRLRVVVNGSVVTEQANITWAGVLNLTWIGVLNAGATVSVESRHENSSSLTGAGFLGVAFNGTVP